MQQINKMIFRKNYLNIINLADECERGVILNAFFDYVFYNQMTDLSLSGDTFSVEVLTTLVNLYESDKSAFEKKGL